MFKESIIMTIRIFTLLFIFGAIGFLPATGHTDDAFASLNTEAQAIIAAKALIGLVALPQDSVVEPIVRSVSVETFSDTSMPLIGQSISGHTAWKVSFGGFESTLSHVEGVEKPIESPRVCDVWLDSLGGNLLRIEIFSLAGNHPFDVPPTKEQMESEARTHGEKYLGLPTVHPELTALEALAVGGRYVVRYIPKAPRIVIRYVMMSGGYPGGTTEFPAWLVRLHGVGVDRVSQRPGPIESKATRFVVNALTGQVMGRFTAEYNIRE